MSIRGLDRCKKGLMSFEAVFSLAVLLIFVSSLALIANVKPVNTTVYEYQLLNDILEVAEKNGGIERLSSYGDVTVLDEMQSLASEHGYCLNLEITKNIDINPLKDLIESLDGGEFIADNSEVWQNVSSSGMSLIPQDHITIYSDPPDNCIERSNKVSTTRTIPTYLGEVFVLKAEMWKQ